MSHWTTVPLTPTLPPWNSANSISLNAISLWYAEYGVPLHTSSSPPVILLHGGGISSRWWSHQIAFLASFSYTVIAVDTRGHGRSTDDLSLPLSYNSFASDVTALLDHLGISKVAVVGWSDGAVTALTIAMQYPSRVDRVFAFGANYSPDNVNTESIEKSAALVDIAPRFRKEYEELNPTPDYEELKTRVRAMQAKEPDWKEKNLQNIPTRESAGHWPLVWITAGDREEIIKREATIQLHDWIPGSALVVFPHVSHFAPLQDPDTFNAMLRRFLEYEKK